MICTVRLSQKAMFQKEKTGKKIETKGKTSNKSPYLEGISKRGATHIVIFTGTMTAIRYCMILDESLKPFIERVFSQRRLPVSAG